MLFPYESYRLINKIEYLQPPVNQAVRLCNRLIGWLKQAVVSQKKKKI